MTPTGKSSPDDASAVQFPNDRTSPMMHGFIPPARYFAYLNWKQVEALPDKENTVLLQPVAAIEQDAVGVDRDQLPSRLDLIHVSDVGLNCGWIVAFNAGIKAFIKNDLRQQHLFACWLNVAGCHV
jgi:hypothetical protein